MCSYDCRLFADASAATSCMGLRIIAKKYTQKLMQTEGNVIAFVFSDDAPAHVVRLVTAYALLVNVSTLMFLLCLSHEFYLRYQVIFQLALA